MPSVSLRSRDRHPVRHGLILLAAVVLAACSADGHASHDHGTDGSADHVHPDVTSFGQPDRPVAGPQGSVPQFVVECGFSHTAADDPIVYPGQPGASHLHVFFGNTDVDAHTVAADLPTGGTTCDQPLDRAAYWAPALPWNGAMPNLSPALKLGAGIVVAPGPVTPFTGST